MCRVIDRLAKKEMDLFFPARAAQVMARGLTVALCLTGHIAAAQDIEQVTVYGGSLSGIWKVSGPGWVTVNLFHGTQWGPPREGFCRIDHNQVGYTTHCYGQAPSSGGSLEVNDKNFHLAWGTTMARLVLDGTVGSATQFTGHFALKLAGVPIEDADEAEGTKIEVKTDASDIGGNAQLVHDILTGATPPHDPAVDAGLTAAHLLQLGGIEAIRYVGQQSKAGGPKTVPDPNYLTVYVVEFEKGELLCALHQSQDATLEAFLCF